jgi:hypothetical protein
MSSGGPVDSIVRAPVVNENPNSPEAMLMRDAKKVQVQASTDSKFDTVLERFSDPLQPPSLPLLAVGVALSLLLASYAFTSVKRTLR